MTVNLFSNTIEETQAKIARLNQIVPHIPVGGSYTITTTVNASPSVTDDLEQAITAVGRLRNITNIKVPVGGLYQVTTSIGR